MAIQIDKAINNDYSLVIQNGDFVYNDQELEHAKEVIITQRGEIRQYPLVGVGLDDYVGSNITSSELFNIISEALLKEGSILEDVTIDVDGNNYTIDLKLK